MSTGVLGLASEWLRGDGGAASDRYQVYPVDPAKQLPFVLRDGATPNGVYGLKMFPEHFDTTTESRWAEALPRLHYVNLVRRDLLGQAISLSIARQTESYGIWIPERREAVYDCDQIRRCLHFLALGEARWRLFYAMNGIQALELIYEDMVADPQSTVNQVARLVGVEGARIAWDKVKTTPQRSARNDAWRQRFLEEAHDVGELPAFGSVVNADTMSAG